VRVTLKRFAPSHGPAKKPLAVGAKGSSMWSPPEISQNYKNTTIEDGRKD